MGWTSKGSVRALDVPAFPSACSHFPQPTNTHTEETWDSNLTGKGVAHSISKLSSPSPAFSGWPSLLTPLCLPLLLGSVMPFVDRAWECQGLSRLSRCPREEGLQHAEAPGPSPSNNQSTELCCPLGWVGSDAGPGSGGPTGQDQLGGEPGTAGARETDSPLGYRDGFVALSPDPLTRGNRVLCAPFSSDDFRGLGEGQGSPFFCPGCGGCGMEIGPIGHPPLLP